MSLSSAALEAEVAAGDEHGEAVVADRAGDEHAVARLRPPEGRPHAPDAGGRDEEAVGAPALDHLRVAGDDRDARLLGGAGHRLRDPAKVLEREAFLDHERGGKPQRLGAGDGEVVDRAVHGQLADVAAREEERLDDERVGREREPVGNGGVAELVEQRVGELPSEELLDELPGRLPARAVGERDEPRRYAAWRP